MKKIKRGSLILLSLLVLATAVHAADKPWKDSGELSYVDTGGNTAVSTLSVKNKLQYKFTDQTEGSGKLGILTGETSGIKTAESYMTELRVDHLISERLYAALIAGWQKDLFAGLDARDSVGPAIGYKIFVGPKHFLKTEAGVDYVTEEYRTTPKTDADYARGRVYGEYGYDFTETNKFLQWVEYLHDFDNSYNYNLNSVTAIISSLNQYFSLKTSYEVRYDNVPVLAVPAKDTTDTLLGVSILATF